MSPSDNHAKCSWVIGSIDLYIDGDLGGDEAAAVERHLQTCPDCGREFAVARTVLDEVRALPGLDCPDPVIDRLSEHIRSDASADAIDRARRWSVKRWFAVRPFGVPRPALAGLFVVVVVVSSLIISRSRQSVEPISPAQVAEAEAAVKWTFAYVNEVSRRSGIAVRTEVFNAGIVRPTERALRSAFDTEEPTQQGEDGGSI